LTNDDSRSGTRRDLVLAAGAFLLFALASSALLMALNPRSPASPAGAQPPPGEGLIDITLVHTNDTWGYLRAFG